MRLDIKPKFLLPLKLLLYGYWKDENDTITGMYFQLRIPIPYIKRINNPYAAGTTEYANHKVVRWSFLKGEGIKFYFFDHPLPPYTIEGTNPLPIKYNIFSY